MISNRTKLLLGGVFAFLFVALWGVLITSFYFREGKIGRQILADLIEIKKLESIGEADYRAKFVEKCLLARQVYQWSWWRTRVSPYHGKLNVEKVYAMSLKDYNELIEFCWDANRYLGLPLDSPDNYMVLSKWILESSINNSMEHKTGEIIKMAGYIENGVRTALYRYRYDLHVSKGHPFYIKELYEENPDFELLFTDYMKVAKFDYAYMLFLLKQYDFKWDFVLTSFHFGEDKVGYWLNRGLKEVPNYRLDGKWKGYWLREYYQTVFEIAQGIHLGKLDRVSRFERVVGTFKKYKEVRDSYVATICLQARRLEKYEETEAKYVALLDAVEKYKKINSELTTQIDQLNDLGAKYKNTLRESEKQKTQEKIESMKVTISTLYQKLRQVRFAEAGQIRREKNKE